MKKCKCCGQSISEEWIPQIIKEKKLEWGKSSDEKMDWYEAKKWCKEQGGRLPTIVELMEAYHGKVEGFESNSYWSSSENSTTNAYRLYFVSGYVGTTSLKSLSYYVRCVRGQ